MNFLYMSNVKNDSKKNPVPIRDSKKSDPLVEGGVLMLAAKFWSVSSGFPGSAA